ncbi:transcriptional regulator, RpiR family [Franzmannia pantelleriensis]|uniref:Transcriptional regulator, RpiR family n=1 Tax=Franzmannia pantelleriensis TaxID=48727 RepID=A0A1G9L4A8_9GAMM|nr:transcriptional regulator HexR [Halomonas pantelleriensis]SDL56557.1 transcriptional regulator, RpiR family [Halomonas pantelleriensis]
MSRALFDELRSRMEHFRRSEQKVARFVLRNPDEVIHMRIVDLATEAKVSEPTVVRFCRALGCNGFQDFKLKLAQMLATGSQFAQFSMNDDDSVAEFSHSIFDSTVGTLLSVRDRLDNDLLSQAISALAMANRVEFYGFGASGAVAFDAQHKFFRLQISTSAYADPHMQNMSAVTLKPGDVVVAISQTGRTKALVASVQLAREVGATVIGLCPSDSPLAAEVSIPLFIDVHEDIEIYTPMSSRIAHLVLIDVLAVGVAKTRGPKLTEQLKSVKRSLNSLRFPEPEE